MKRIVFGHFILYANLETTEYKLYQIVVGVLNFDPWPQQQALTERSMLYIFGKQLRKCWDGQLLTAVEIKNWPV